jgi:hypothetical protein
MSWDVRQTRRFARSYKKLHDNLVVAVDQAVSDVADNPDIGEKKKGGLAELCVHKFHALGQLYLLGYVRTSRPHLGTSRTDRRPSQTPTGRAPRTDPYRQCTTCWKNCAQAKP